MKEPVDLERFQATSMLIKVASDEAVPLRAEWTIPVVIDKEYELAPQTITVDGNLNEWTDPWWSTGATPELSGAIGQWNGVEDCSYSLAIRYDDRSIYFATKVTDDLVMEGDSVTLVIDPRLQLNRLQATQLGRETLATVIAAPAGSEWSECALSGVVGRPVVGARAMGRRVAGGYEVELSLPIDKVVEQQGEAWASIQAGVRVRDVDAIQDQPFEVLWRTSSELRANRPLAHLIRK
jgi:hypothetical protein